MKEIKGIKLKSDSVTYIQDVGSIKILKDRTDDEELELAIRLSKFNKIKSQFNQDLVPYIKEIHSSQYRIPKYKQFEYYIGQHVDLLYMAIDRKKARPLKVNEVIVNILKVKLEANSQTWTNRYAFLIIFASGNYMLKTVSLNKASFTIPLDLKPVINGNITYYESIKK